MEAVQRSYAMMMPIMDDITRKFFEILRERHPQMRHFFPESADGRNSEHLTAAIDRIVNHIDEPTRLRPMLMQAGRYFACQGAVDGHYDNAVDALLRTLAFFFHIGWSHELRKQWILIFAICANTMKQAGESAGLGLGLNPGIDSQSTGI